MKAKKGRNYFIETSKKMRKHFKAFVCTQSPESLHKFRVQVKKTRSFLTLLEAGNKNDKLLKRFKPIRRLFKQTGIIRDAFIHQEQAKENHLNAPQFYKEQQTLQQEKTNQLINRQHQLLHRMTKVQRRLVHHMNAISKNKMEQFFSAQITNAKQLLISHDFSEQLHNGRKMLKHLLYNRHLIPKAMSQEMKVDFDYIDAMQQAIGDWHDNKLAVDFFGKKLPAKDLETIKHKQEDLKKNIIAKAALFVASRPG